MDLIKLLIKDQKVMMMMIGIGVWFHRGHEEAAGLDPTEPPEGTT